MAETKKFNGVVYKRYTIGTDYTASAKDVKRAQKLATKLREDKFYAVRVTRTSRGVPVVWYRMIARATGKLPVDYKRIKGIRYKLIQYAYSKKSGAKGRIAASRRRGDKAPMLPIKSYGKWWVYRKA